MLAKQAKILTDGQIKAVLSYLESTRNASRNKVMFLFVSLLLLSIYFSEFLRLTSSHHLRQELEQIKVALHSIICMMALLVLPMI